MAKRVVEAILKFQDQFSSGLDKATQKFNANTKKMMGVGRGVWKAGKNIEGVGKGLTAAITAPVAGLATVSVKEYGEVDKTMRLAKETMGATAKEFGVLRDSMMSAAQDSVFSVKDAADATVNFARQGFSASEASKMLPGAMNLAAGTATDLAATTAGLGNAMKIFGADSKDATRYANIFAKGQAQANTTTTDLFNAASVAGPMFKTMGWNLKDLATATDIFGDAGVSGAEGANAMKSGLANLTSPRNKAAAITMKELGINITNADGTMKSFSKTQEILHKGFARLTQEQKIQAAEALFGKNQMSKWLTVIDAAPGKVKKLQKGLEAASVGKGTAKNMADALMSGVGGSIEKLKSTFDVFKQQIGGIAGEVVKPMIDRTTTLIAKFNSLDDGTKKTIVRFALMAAAVGPALIGVGKLTQGIGNGIQAFARLPQAVSGFTKLVSGIPGAFSGLASGITALPATLAPIMTMAAPIAAIAGSVLLIGGAFISLYKNNEAFRNSVKTTIADVKSAFGQFVTELRQRIPILPTSFSEAVAGIRAAWSGFTKILAPVLTGAMRAAVAGIRAAFDTIIGILDVFKGLFTGDWKTLWSGIKRILTAQFTVIKRLAKISLDTLRNTFKTVFSMLPKPVQTAMVSVKNKIVSNLSSAKSRASSLLSSMQSTFSSRFASIRQRVSDLASRLKNAFNFSWKLPDLKLPHVSVTGGTAPFGIGGKGSLPKFSVSWYKKAYDNAYMLRRPTIFGRSGDTLLGGGDGNGSEMIIGTDKLISTFKQAVTQAVVTRPETSSGPQVTINVNISSMQVRSDEDVHMLASELANQISLAAANAA